MMFRSLTPFFVVAAVLSATAAIILLGGKPRTHRDIDPAFGAYIYAYTGGTIAKTGAVRVRFTEAMANREQIGKPAEAGSLVLTPNIAGKTVWEDAYTLRFTPDVALPSGTVFEGSVPLKRFFPNVEAKLATFEFSFRTKLQTLAFKPEGFDTPSNADYTKTTYKASLTTSDAADPAAVERCLSAKLGSQSVKNIVWTHTPDHLTHAFEIQGIVRSKEAAILNIDWNGADVQAKTRGSHKVEVAAADVFKILDARMEGDATPYAVLYCSDPVKPEQDLAGLIEFATTFAGENASPDDAAANGDNNTNIPNDGGEEGEPVVMDSIGTAATASPTSATHAAGTAVVAVTPAKKKKEAAYTYNIVGHQIFVYPTGIDRGVRHILVHAGIKNTHDTRLAEESHFAVALLTVKPMVRKVGMGVIMPTSEGLYYPFEATGLTAVDVEVVKIHANNVLQYLQSNDLDDGGSNLDYIGKIIVQKRIELNELEGVTKNGKWMRYGIDLSDLIKAEQGAIYRIHIGFRPAYAACDCDKPLGKAGSNPVAVGEANGMHRLTSPRYQDNNQSETFHTIMRWSYRDEDSANDTDDDSGEYEYNGDGDNRNDDPCTARYYNRDHFIGNNVLGSNLGLIAKRGRDGSMLAVVTDLTNTQPLTGVKVEWLDKAKQPLASATTDKDGFARATTELKPYFLVATYKNEKGYLKLEDGNSLNLSRFEVEGQNNPLGLKGLLYGERGVWRPGDSLYLTFMLQDSHTLPLTYPVTLELYDSRGKMTQRITKVNNLHHVYNFSTCTSPTAPTGVWTAKVLAGGAVFTKTLKIETVKPNRMKLRLDFGKEALAPRDSALDGKLNVQWLHGAPAKGLRATVEVSMKSVTTTFPKYPKYGDYRFDDITRSYKGEPATIYDNNLDDNGNASVKAHLRAANAPGKMQATFLLKAFERGGEYSFFNTVLPYDPYNGYVGVRLPNTSGYKGLTKDKPNTVRFATVDTEGKPQGGHKLRIGVYRLEWRWWWDSNTSFEDYSKFNSATHFNAILTGDATTNNNGEAEWQFTPKTWGRYLVRVTDEVTGHTTGDICYTEYDWGGDQTADREKRQNASMLAFAPDKKKYAPSEKVTLTVPMGEKGRALVTLENGQNIIKSFWVEATKGENKITFVATADMSPLVYAHVSLIQPHAQVKNDLPMRMYGVAPIVVENPSSRLFPVADMPEVLRPEQPFTLKVHENSGKAMTYTVDIVDEGLLDLTGYKTPDPWANFNVREALGVKTWDLYDYVLGAFGSTLDRILALGGDEDARRKNHKSNRFAPVVKHLGPFYIEKGKTGSHTITLPNYVGSVRAMVVASDDATNAYGSSEKTVAVKKPLMILATLPRVLCPGEVLQLPANVFAMEPQIKNVTVTVKDLTTGNDAGLLAFTGEKTQTLTFAKPDDDIINFDLRVANKAGIAKVRVEAVSGNERSYQDIEIEVRNPNPYMTDVKEVVIEAGKTASLAITPLGMDGTNEATLEVSAIPPINLAARLGYLVHYPYGCIEQTTSSVFPQLYVGRFMNLSEVRKREIQTNIKAGITRLASDFQNAEGGFGYWQGDRYSSEWGTTYGGHFLLEAEAAGYAIPAGTLERWATYQKKMARQWQTPAETANHPAYSDWAGSELSQAYRLYTLAVAKQPDLAAMNRLREYPKLTAAAKWRLAAAYAAIGKADVAKNLTTNLPTAIAPYIEDGDTYGSDTRDGAMILETLTMLDSPTEAANVAKELSAKLARTTAWYSTQTTAYALLALSKWVGNNTASQGLSFEYTMPSATAQTVRQKEVMYNYSFNPDKGFTGKSIAIQNTNAKGVLFARIITRGQPPVMATGAAAAANATANNNLNMKVTYLNLKGDPIQPDALEQGVDFVAEVRITNPGKRGNLRNLALAQVFPSGWEIRNTRLELVASALTDGSDGKVVADDKNTKRGTKKLDKSVISQPDYQDFRDDRVNTFFHVASNQTQVFRVQLNASYLGRFFLPAMYCEAMYDGGAVNARQAGRWVEVMPAGSMSMIEKKGGKKK